jgi:hypothetical protein
MVVDILLLQTVSIAIASVSVVAGVVYYAVQIRHQSKTRQTGLLMNLYLTWGSDDMRKAVQDSIGLENEYKDYDDFVKKYGISSQAWVDVNKILWFMNGVGFLVHEGFVNIKLVLGLFQTQGVMRMWEKWKPFVEGQRKMHDLPESYAWLEYLYNEVKKRQQRGVKNG